MGSGSVLYTFMFQLSDFNPSHLIFVSLCSSVKWTTTAAVISPVIGEISVDLEYYTNRRDCSVSRHLLDLGYVEIGNRARPILSLPHDYA